MTTHTHSLSESIEANPRPLLYAVVGLLVVVFVAVMVMQNRSTRSMDAQGVLHYAMQAYEKTQTPEAQKLGFADRYRDALPKLEAVVATYPGTRAAFEAGMTAGNIYFSGARWDEARGTFQKAQAAAAGELEKGVVSIALAQILEAQKKWADALPLFEKAAQSAAGSPAQGEALLGVARMHAALGKADLAKATYEKIGKDLPNTPFARRADALKAAL